MVREIKYFECDICNKRHPTKQIAKDCESEGVPKLYPVGMIFCMMNDDMVFAITKQHPKSFGHHHSYSTHACRDTNAGDNKFGESCGLESWSKIHKPDKKLKCYKRIIKTLKDNGITPSDYKGDAVYTTDETEAKK